MPLNCRIRLLVLFIRGQVVFFKIVTQEFQEFDMVLLFEISRRKHKKGSRVSSMTEIKKEWLDMNLEATTCFAKTKWFMTYIGGGQGDVTKYNPLQVMLHCWVQQKMLAFIQKAELYKLPCQKAQ